MQQSQCAQRRQTFVLNRGVSVGESQTEPRLKGFQAVAAELAPCWLRTTAHSLKGLSFMKRAVALAVMLLWPLCHSAAAQGVSTPPVQWAVASGGNGHWYAFVSDPGVTWTEAEAAAETSGGYLATITTS